MLYFLLFFPSLCQMHFSCREFDMLTAYLGKILGITEREKMFLILWKAVGWNNSLGTQSEVKGIEIPPWMMLLRIWVGAWGLLNDLRFARLGYSNQRVILSNLVIFHIFYSYRKEFKANVVQHHLCSLHFMLFIMLPAKWSWLHWICIAV